jgi:hypothetical protein
MNIELLKKFFQVEAATNTGSVLTLPSGITKDLAQEITAQLALEPVIHGLAVLVAKEVGNRLTTMALRPADYIDIKELPDELIERIIEELAKKPDMFFKTFRDNLKLQG